MRKHFSFKFSLLFLCLLSVGVNIVNAQESALENRFAEVLSLPSVPIQANSVKLKKGNEGIVLDYTVDKSGAIFSELEFLAIVINKSGEVRGGQGWLLKKTDVNDFGLIEDILLSTQPETGDTVVLMVIGARGESVKYSASSLEIRNRLNSFRISAKSSNSLSKSNSEKFILAVNKVKNNIVGPVCDNNLCQTKNTCGCGGVSSFTCNEETGSYSFTCFPKNGCIDEPPLDCGAGGTGPQ